MKIQIDDNILDEVEDLIYYSLAASEGLQPAYDQMDRNQYSYTASGVFGLIAEALKKAHKLISEYDD